MLIISTLFMLFFLPYGSSSWAAGITIVDDVGRTVSLKSPARKVVLTDGMGLIGLALIDPDPIGHLAAWNRGRLDKDILQAFEKSFPQVDRIPDVGELAVGPAAVEALIRTNPDLVILDPYFNRSPSMIRQIESAGIQVAVLALTPSIRDSEPASGILRLAILIGREKRGRAYSEFFGSRLATIRNRVKNLPNAERPWVLLEAHARPKVCCVVAGAGQGIGDFVTFVGGHNLGTDILPGMAGQINPEYILKNPPLVYIGTGGSYLKSVGGLSVGLSVNQEEAQSSLSILLERIGLNTSPAVKTGRAYGLWHAFSDLRHQ
ncbi:ABC transporter substrate-binding protein, partial [Agrobacterium sp. S2]|nr:ABC transporter substrate-binding protein [Agrobacterium sp. S2]